MAEPRRPVVLIVDDDRGIRGVLGEMLAADYELVMAHDGPTALDAFERRRMDAVILDVRMPGMDGLEVLRRMKTIDPRVEVILLTGVNDVPTVVEGVKRGAFDYVTKPWDVDDLLDRLARAIHRRESDEVFLVGNEVGRLTALHVIVERSVATAVSLSPATALKGVAGRPPRLVIVESPLEPPMAVELVSGLRARYQESAFLVIAADAPAAEIVRESAGLPPWAVLPASCSLGEVLDRIAIAVTPLGEPRVVMPPLPPAVAAAIEHVIQHHRDRLLAEDVARPAGLSARQLGDAFRDCLGMSAKEFVTRFRMSAACRLLTDDTHTLGPIAEMTGFEDASHLSHVFSRYLGMRPGEYRRRFEARAS